MAEQEKSVTWVIVMLFLLIAVLGWAFAAAGYAHSEEGWRTGGVQGTDDTQGFRRGSRRALGDFIGNSFRQIPNMSAVISFTFEHRLWLVITVGVLEGLLLIGGYKMKSLEKELSGPRQRRR